MGEPFDRLPLRGKASLLAFVTAALVASSGMAASIGQALGDLDGWAMAHLTLVFTPFSGAFILLLAGLPFAWLWLRGWANMWTITALGSLCGLAIGRLVGGPLARTEYAALGTFVAIGSASAFSFWAILRIAALFQTTTVNAKTGG